MEELVESVTKLKVRGTPTGGTDKVHDNVDLQVLRLWGIRRDCEGWNHTKGIDY